MLTLKECRKIVDDSKLTDEEVLLMRDWLYHMADIAIDAVEQQEKKQNSNGPAT